MFILESNLSKVFTNMQMYGNCFSFPSNHVISSPRIAFFVTIVSLLFRLPPLSCPSIKTPEECRSMTSFRTSLARVGLKILSTTQIFFAFQLAGHMLDEGHQVPGGRLGMRPRLCGGACRIQTKGWWWHFGQGCHLGCPSLLLLRGWNWWAGCYHHSVSLF